MRLFVMRSNSAPATNTPPTRYIVVVPVPPVSGSSEPFWLMISYLPQYPQFYPNFRVKEFLMYMCSIKDISQKKAKEILPEILEEVNLYDHMYKKIKELSEVFHLKFHIS